MKPQPQQLLFSCRAPNYASTRSSRFPGQPRGKKKFFFFFGKRKPPPTYHYFLRPFQRRIGERDLPGRAAQICTFKNEWGDPREKPKTRELTLHAPPGPASKGRRRAAGTRAGRRAQPGRARPQARLIFMSAREAPLLHGRPAGPRRPPPAFVPFPPPAGPPSLRTRGRGPSAPAGLPPPLSPAPRQRRVGWPGVAGREGARGEPALLLHPPAGAAPCPPRRKVKHILELRRGSQPSSWVGPGKPKLPLELRWVGKIPRKRKWQPTPVFLPGKSHGHRSLVAYSPHAESLASPRDEA